MSRKDSCNRLRQRQQFLGRYEVVKQLRLIWHRAQATAYVHFETELFPARGLVHAALCNQSEVVQARQSACMLRASTKCRLKLAPKTLAVRMPQQKLCQRLRVWRHIKGFVGADTRIRTRSYIAHRISASLARR